MKSLYEKRIKQLEDTNLALNKTYRKLETRVTWILLLVILLTGYLLLEEFF